MPEEYNSPDQSASADCVDAPWSEKTESQKVESTCNGIRALMAFLPDAEVEVLCAEHLNLVRNGAPRPAFDDVAEEARIWADHASPSEIAHYAFHAFLRMSPDVKKRFAERVALETQG